MTLANLLDHVAPLDLDAALFDGVAAEAAGVDADATADRRARPRTSGLHALIRRQPAAMIGSIARSRYRVALSASAGRLRSTAVE